MMTALLYDDYDLLDGEVRIPSAEYEALTHLESQVRRIAARHTPVSRDHLAGLLQRIRSARAVRS